MTPVVNPDAVFPNEIFQLVITHVASQGTSDSLANLRACSLVSKVFVALCQPYLVRQISIGPHTRSSREHFAELFSQKPHLRNHVKSLTYRIEYDEEEEEPIIPRFSHFMELKNVQSLCIESLYGSREYEVDSHHDPEIFCYSTLMKHYLFTNTLTKLSLFMINDVPLPYILSSPSLVTLELFHCQSSSWSDDVFSASELRAPKLETLVAFDYDGTDISILSHCRALKTLTVGMSTLFDGDYDEAAGEDGTYLKPLLPSLKQLRFHMDLNGQRMEDPFIEYLHTLEHLVFIAGPDHFKRGGFDEPIECVDMPRYLYQCRASLKRFCTYVHAYENAASIVNAIYDSLAPIESQNSLETLDFIFCLRRDATVFEDLESCLNTWTKIDTLLLNTPESFPALRHVSIHIVFKVDTKHLQAEPSPSQATDANVSGQNEPPNSDPVLEFEKKLRGALTGLHMCPEIVCLITFELFEGDYLFPGDLEYGRYIPDSL